MQITDTEFNDAVSQTRMTEQSIEIAREIILLGKTPREVSESRGVSRQRVESIANRVRDILAPGDLVCVTYVVTKDVADQIEEMIK